MNVIGDSLRWRRELLDVYALVREAIIRNWPDCCTRIRSASLSAVKQVAITGRKRRKATLEDPITRDLVRLLKRDEEIRGRFHVVSQLELIEEHLDLDPDPKGYLDVAILFFIGEDDICLALECKRLNVVWQKRHATLAREYVDNGMMRFVTGQYASDLPLGGMIGYVMDGDVAGAQASVREQILNASLRLLLGSRDINVLSWPDYFATIHHRLPTWIELRHQLLSVN